MLGTYRRSSADSLRFFLATHGVSLARSLAVQVYASTEGYVQRLARYLGSEVEARDVARWAMGWAGDREVLIDHSRLREPFRQYQTLAHELTHQLQIELAGFDQQYSDRAWKSCWMAEGHAEFVSWKVGDRTVTSYDRARISSLDAIRGAPRFSLKQAAGACGTFRPLQNQVGGEAAYGMSMLAVETLVEQHGSPAIAAYFRNLASQSAGAAFQTAFRVSMSDFLTEFEARLARELGR